jgi:hypothetical protein
LEDDVAAMPHDPRTNLDHRAATLPEVPAVGDYADGKFRRRPKSSNSTSSLHGFLTMQAQRRLAFALGLVSASQAPLQRRVVCLAKLVC